MLKDIKNVMSTKRSNSNSSSMSATILDTHCGKEYEIPIDKDFVIGRSLDCSHVLEHIFVSRYHCVIRYNNGQFIIYDNNTHTGTYINCIQIPKGKQHFKVLNHGDLIGFGDTNNLIVTYKFCISAAIEKKSRLMNQQSDLSIELNKLKSHFKNSLAQLTSETQDLKIDQLICYTKTKTLNAEFQRDMKSVIEFVSKLGTEISKQKNINQELNKKVIEYKNALVIQQELLDTAQLYTESDIETFKKEIYRVLENEFQCPICNDVIVKATILNCSHSFCNSCLNQWLNKSKVCPVCRSQVKTTTNFLSMDSCITNICDAIGGTIKEQRDNLEKERLVPPVRTASKRGRKKTIRRQEPPMNYLSDLMRYNPNIEVVDLTTPR